MSLKKATYFLSISFVFFNLICPILSLDADVGQETKTKIERKKIVDNGAAAKQVLNEKPRYQMPYPATWQILNSGQCDKNIYFNDNFVLSHKF